MGISTEYDPLRPMAIQKNWHLTFQPKFMLFAQRSPAIEKNACSQIFTRFNTAWRLLGHSQSKSLEILNFKKRPGAAHHASYNRPSKSP